MVVHVEVSVLPRRRPGCRAASGGGGRRAETASREGHVLDADNTLWGGIVGEDGMDGIALGPDYPGNCYVAFQRRVLEYRQRGFILALCSKNNEADVLEVLRRHPHQVLREEHFAALRVNWQDKPQNLQALADELNLGLDSLVFVDDSAHECSVVRRTLPMIEVVQTPARAVDVPTCLDRVSRLEIIALTEEDRRKSEICVQNRIAPGPGQRERRRVELLAGDGGRPDRARSRVARAHLVRGLPLA